MGSAASLWIGHVLYFLQALFGSMSRVASLLDRPCRSFTRTIFYKVSRLGLILHVATVGSAMSFICIRQGVGPTGIYKASTF